MNISNPFSLSDTDLTDSLDRLKAEVNRRSMFAIANFDEATIVKGHEYAKRAIIVAAVGQHSMLFVGGPFGKTLLRALAHRLGVTETFEARPCSCGFMGDSLNPCNCAIDQIDAQVATHPVAEVFVEVIRVPEFEMAAQRTGTTIEMMREQIRSASQRPTNVILEKNAKSILKSAVDDLGLTPGERQKCIAVAKSIAYLDGESTIKSSHMAEAIGYRMPRRRRIGKRGRE